ncbi:electron transfer flavoprotein subunit alpha/FixB family protein [Acidobacteriota bacterium]
MSENSVMVFIEKNGTGIADVSLELLCKATELAEQLGVPVEGIAVGHNMSKELEVCGHFGCQTVYVVEDERLSFVTSTPYAKAVSHVIKKHRPQIVLFGATAAGRDIAPRVASELKCGLTADCTALQIGEHTLNNKTHANTLLQIRPAFGGNIIATIASPESRPSMATVREGVMKMGVPDTTKAVETIQENHILSNDDFITEVIEVVREQKSVNLKSAQIVVSAGMGAASPEAIHLIKDLAKSIGAELGASRAAVDSGLINKDHQVGQTGTTIRPNLYIACGISGQIQHRAGMSESKRIIAINSDPSAPIFEIAHYGIVGKIESVIPKFISAYRARG